MKKLFLQTVIILSLLLIFLVPVSGNAYTYGDLTYTINSDNTAITITDCDTSVTEVTIPSEIDGIPVTTIGTSAFSVCKGLTNVTIPDSVTTIGNYAFYSCSGLTSVTIPDSVTTIGNYAFYGCSGLTSVTIPDSVTTIGDSAFSCCSGLTSVTIPDSVTTIGYDAFSYCTALKSVSIPESVTTIKNYAFSGCRELESVYITDIASWCDIDFGDSSANPMFLADKMYLNDNLLTNLVIPDSVEMIKKYAFYQCRDITSLTIGSGVTCIDNDAFAYCSKISSITISKSVVEIEAGSFKGCNAISTINYEGSENDWAALYIGSDNGSLTSATVNYGIVLPLIISYDANGGSNAPLPYKADYNSTVTISDIVPVKEGYVFLGWSKDKNSTKAEYKSGDTLTIGEKNITLYAVWQRSVHVTTAVTNNVYIVTPTGVEAGECIVFACFKDNELVFYDDITYNNESAVPFAPNVEFDNAKVLVWESLTNIKPLCNVHFAD